MSDQDKRRRDDDTEDEPILPVTGGDDLDDEHSQQPDPEAQDPEDEYYDSLDVEGMDFRASDLETFDDFGGDGDVVPSELLTGILEDDATDEGMISDEELRDIMAMDANPDQARAEAARYTDDEDIQDIFEERQSLAGGRGKLIDGLIATTGKSPDLSANDIDADSYEQSGEETIGGENPTPDQDVVDDIGKGAGLTYADDEALDYSKVNRRDEQRWELNPESAESDPDEVGDEDRTGRS